LHQKHKIGSGDGSPTHEIIQRINGKVGQRTPSPDPIDGEINPSKDELDGGRFWTLEEIRAAIGQQILTPNFESEFQRFFL
jgi:hypothetical protein